MTGGYDEGYRSCPCFWGKVPGSLVARLSSFVPSFIGMEVLDVGCGEGKNAAYLAGKGAIVEAIDISALALSNAKAAWPQSKVRWTQGDVRSVTLEKERYDLVIAYGLLHCLESQDQVSEAIRCLQTATARGGWNIVCAFNERRQELHAHPGFNPILCSHKWLVGHYAAWDLLHATDEDLIESHPTNDIVHRHSMTRILARKANV